MLQLNRQRFGTVYAVLTVVAVCLGQDGLLNPEEFSKMWILGPRPDDLNQNLQGIMPGIVISLKFP